MNGSAHIGNCVGVLDPLTAICGSTQKRTAHAVLFVCVHGCAYRIPVRFCQHSPYGAQNTEDLPAPCFVHGTAGGEIPRRKKYKEFFFSLLLKLFLSIKNNFSYTFHFRKIYFVYSLHFLFCKNNLRNKKEKIFFRNIFFEKVFHIFFKKILRMIFFCTIIISVVIRLFTKIFFLNFIFEKKFCWSESNTTYQ